MNEKRKQITATISLSSEDKTMLMKHAKMMNTTLSALLVDAALQVCALKKLIIDLDKPDGFVLLPMWMTPEHLTKAAKYLELLEGPVLPLKE